LQSQWKISDLSPRIRKLDAQLQSLFAPRFKLLEKRIDDDVREQEAGNALSRPNPLPEYAAGSQTHTKLKQKQSVPTLATGKLPVEKTGQSAVGQNDAWLL